MKRGLNELALFAGVFGGAIGTSALGWNPVCAIERDEYARNVLMARQNDGCLHAFPIWDDVRTFDGTEWRGKVDIISGGFPCQAFSTAARGRNNAANLWPDMFRIVKECQPRFVFAENVSTKAIDAACDDLETVGYETRAISLSASDLGGDHERERHWLLAYSDDKSELLGGIDAKMALRKIICNRIWETFPGESRISNGVAHRVDRFRATGNGQVSIVALAAVLILAGDL